MAAKKDCILVIAGPSSGKTHNMVQKALEYLPELEPHRFMALITYTNAATEQIRGRLQKKIKIPENFFIGTIHSFLNRFILKPYGKIFNLLPKEYFFVEGMDFSFLDGKSFNDTIHRRNCERSIENKRFEKGIVTYNKLESEANGLIDSNKTTVRRALGNRLQFLFLDEIQDATSRQYRVVENIRVEGKTKIYCIGDPEQYIYGFTYIAKNQKPPEFIRTPIKKLENNSKIIKKTIREEERNERSTSKIVKFLNNFRAPPQKELIKRDNEADVMFINKTEVNEIVRIFNELCDNSLPDDVKGGVDFCKFFLSYSNNTFNPVFSAHDMIKISNDSVKPRSILKLVLDYILAVSGKTQAEILLETNMSVLDFRKIGLLILHKIKEMPEINETEIIEHIKSGLTIEFNRANQKTDFAFNNLVSNFQSLGISPNKNSSIHKAKGLEASAVLALADTKNRLSKWIETDSSIRGNDRKDECRLGFVAFSRAKDFLCIACLEKVEETILRKLTDLGVVVAT